GSNRFKGTFTMNPINRFLAFIFLSLFISCSAFAGGFQIGKYAGEFMALGVGGRALGMGSAYVALANDVTAGYWNPAGLARIVYPEISLMHDEQFGSLVNYDYGAVAFPYGSNQESARTAVDEYGESHKQIEYNAASFGVSVFRLGIDGIPDTRKAWNDINGDGIFNDGADIRPDYSQITFFDAADWAVYFTYAKQRSENFYWGANLKLIRRNIGDFHGTGIGFDLGALCTPSENLTLGANIQDVTTTLVAWSTGTNELISPTAKVGGAFTFEFLGGRFAPAVDVDIRFEDRKYSAMAHLGPVSFDPHGGVEYEFKQIAALRVGMNDIGNLTLGAGVHLPELDIDYAFAKFDGADQLGNSHRISLRLVLEEEKYRR
ncbi:MAG: hypothetical protein KGJ59_06845, partial [Bacteroidota bacterium]|nr:hypothetical protein [Bacteroidota bacterium]